MKKIEERVLYKYLPNERQSFFINNLLRVTQPADLNDSFECSPIMPSSQEHIDTLKKVAAKRIKSINGKGLTKKERIDFKREVEAKVKEEILRIKSNDDESLPNKFAKRAFDNLNSKVGIFSLTKNWDNLLMWSHYADNQKGFCVGFNSVNSIFQNQGNPFDPFNLVSEVIYSTKRIKVPLTPTPINYEVVLQKSLDWAYEEEVRLITLLSLSKKIIESKPFDIHLFEFPPSTVKEIMLGAKVDETLMEKAKVYCRTNDIELYQCMLDSEEYKMNKKLIELDN